MDEKFDTIIIGAGLSGLFCGSYLTKKGQKVCIIEKNREIGGAIQPFTRKNEWFDTGMHYFGAVNDGQIQNKLFKIFGINNDFEIKNIDNFKFWHNGKEYNNPVGYDKYKAQLLLYFPKEKKAIEIYISKLKEIIGNITIENILKGFEFSSDHNIGIYNFVRSITNNKELQDVLTFNNMLYGGERDKSSVYIHSVINGSFLQSTGFFKNGSIDFLESVKNKIKSLGGVFVNSKKVDKLDVKNGKINCCITEDGSKYFANNYISTLHPKLTLDLTDTKLIKKFYRKRISELKNTKSTFLIYVLMKENSFLYQESPLFSSESDNVWDLHNSYLFQTPISGKKGKYARQVKIMTEMSFEDVENMLGQSSKKRTSEYLMFKKQRAEEIFNSIENKFSGFKNCIKTYYTSSPLTYLHYTGTIKGSSYGIINDFNHPIRTMLPIRTKIKNLFLSGQNINFHGMLGVSITALMTCNAVLESD